MTPDELAKRGLRIKPLVWRQVSTYFGGVFDANEYRVAQWHPPKWSTNTLPNQLFETHEAAKAAAQADYEARIIAALECFADPALAAEARGMRRAAEMVCGEKFPPVIGAYRMWQFMPGDRSENSEVTGFAKLAAQAIRAAAKELTQ